MLPLIGVVGLARSGKNHVAKILCEEYGFVTWALANPIKCMTYAKSDSWPLEAVLGNQDKTVELRTELQLEGTERGRMLYRPDLWIRYLEAFLYATQDWNLKGMVISDVRFPNEVDFIRSRGGLLLRVFNADAGLPGAAGAHASEIFINSLPVDGTIDNTGRPERSFLLRQLQPYIQQSNLGV